MKYSGTEHQLCEELHCRADKHGWLFYPEICGWDILLVRQGVQIGIQAKTSANCHVIYQAMAEVRYRNDTANLIADRKVRCGPHFRAVLVPIEADFVSVAHWLGIWVFGTHDFGDALLESPVGQPKFQWIPEKLHTLPDVIPQVPAGVPSPVSLTPWKQRALKLLARAQIKGVTSRDATELKVNLQLFKDRHWLRSIGKEGKRTLWVLEPVPPTKRPDQQHPKEFQHYLEREMMGCAIA